MSKGVSLSAMLENRARDGRGTVRFLELRKDLDPIPVRELALQAGRIGSGLQARGLRPGALLAFMLRSDLDFARIFLGAAAGGIVPVPLYPPTSLKRLDHFLTSLKGVLAIIQPEALVVMPEVRPVLELVKRDSLRGVRLFSLDDLLASEEEPIFEPREAEDIAFIQCTSGSTNVPKPVIVQNRNVLANLDAIGAHGGDHAKDAMCIWLPMFHDMGLLGMMRPLRHDHSLVLMEPQTFLRKPVRWLHGFSRYGATLGGAPNFSFDLMVRKVSEQEREELDLSPWRFAYNGAEPIRVSVIERFLETYAPYGLRQDLMMPCYGMSESTLTATMPAATGAVLRRSFDMAELEQGRARVVEEGSDGSLTLSGVGVALPDHEILVVDPETGGRLSEGRVGLILLTGASVSPGYLNLPEPTRSSFGQWVEGDERTWFRTSDLGFHDQGELFVVGRADDLIIVRGRNICPNDIEAAVEKLDGIRAGCTAAVRAQDAVSDGTFIFVAETTRPPDEALRKGVEGRIRSVFAVAPAEVMFVPRGTIPKTSSGKVSRGVIRQRLRSGKLQRNTSPEWVRGLKLKARIAVNRVRNALARD